MESRPDKTPRMLAARKCCRDEGIVQAFSKEREQLSRRLHQPADPDMTSGSFFPKASWMNTYRTYHPLTSTKAANLAGLIDGEGTVTLSRKHRNENRQLAVTISNTGIRLLEYVQKSSALER